MDPNKKIKDFAISQYPREKGNRIMGYSIRTEKYRYTRWIKFNSPNKEIVEQELYDLSNEKTPIVNFAYDKEYRKTVKELNRKLSKELTKYTTYK